MRGAFLLGSAAKCQDSHEKRGEILTFSESNRGEVRPEKSETVGLGDTRISNNDERVTKDGASGIRHLVIKSDFVIWISPVARSQAKAL